MEKKELIRKTAIELFAANGFAKTTTPMIAETAQVSIGTVYKYFKNKEEILDYIYEVEFVRRKELLLNLEELNIPIAEKIYKLIEFHLEVAINYPDIAKIFFQDSTLPYNQKLNHVNKMMTYLPERCIEIIRKAQQRGEVKDVVPELVGPAIFYATRALIYSLQTQGNIPDYRKVQEELNRFIIRALHNP